MRISEIIRVLEARAPSGTAEDWDNVGLLLGDPDWKTSGAVVSVDLTPKSIELARSKGFRLIINHHPCIFPKTRGLARITAGGSGTSGIVFEAMRAGIAVAAYHTNFDQCALEVIQSVAQGIGAVPKGRLLEKPAGSLTKLVVFVPRTHLEKVRRAIMDAGAGQIGNYDSCSFSVAGEGTFRGGEATNPFLGQPGRLEKAEEVRLETVFPKGFQKQVLQALFAAHPYEEVAFDLYPLKQEPANQGIIPGLGYGFWGDFPKAKAFSDLAQDVKRLFKINGFWMTEPVPTRVKRVGFVAGKGGSFLSPARAAGCDLLITGEAGYHTALEGVRQGIGVMELGHRESERFFRSTVRSWLKEAGLKSVELDQATQKIQ